MHGILTFTHFTSHRSRQTPISRPLSASPSFVNPSSPADSAYQANGLPIFLHEFAYILSRKIGNCSVIFVLLGKEHSAVNVLLKMFEGGHSSVV